ncbi:MFS general substrate transporter [Dacryopinax primogenitus]|uniref:Autophagy-related protein n=1 Tax=Dacryopinax primogenitus (strain DJM 731) TaxID=1858805 RepID=M5GF94_DACPD|nr:MFS general substrate transporter [Dacryopinax primogenitus]EJU03963.1 MFS general substrate transporter [Dacryopinax primogenitus]
MVSTDDSLSLLPSSPTPLLPIPDHNHTQSQYISRLRGWLTYAFASEAFAVCSLGLFLPVLLEQFARENGVLLPERSLPCVPGTGEVQAEGGRCVVRIGWAWVDTASFSLYVYSTSVAIQALTVISLGGIADHGKRKPLLLSFALLGSCSTTLFLFLPSHSPLWPICALLAITANVAFGASIVALNAYLPGLARDAPEVRAGRLAVDEAFRHLREDDTDLDDSAFNPEAAQAALKDWHTLISRTTARISARGIALGYFAGILALLLLLIPVTLLKGSTFSLRLCVGLSGIWWGVFTLPAAAWLPSDSTTTNTNITPNKPQPRSTIREIASAWAELGRMLLPSHILQLKHTFLFLAAWFLLSDTFTTISSTAILFSKTSLHLPPTSLMLIAILAPCSGVIGALTCTALQQRYAWSNKRVLLTLVLLLTVVPAYGCLGFFLPSLGLKHSWEMYILALYYGFINGSFQSYARALFSELIPRGEEARFFGLYSITDKSSSFLGPLVVGVIADKGEIRNAFWFLLGMVLVAWPVLAGVDPERGREEAAGYRRLDGEEEEEGDVEEE